MALGGGSTPLKGRIATETGSVRLDLSSYDPCHSVTITLIGVSIVTAICRKFLNLPFGVFIAFKPFIFSREDKMLQSADRELQARLLKEISELYTRKQKLEDAIRSVDAVTLSLHQTAALRDIEARKGQRPLRRHRLPVNL
jgi:hypothetical protein